MRRNLGRCHTFQGTTEPLRLENTFNNIKLIKFTAPLRSPLNHVPRCHIHTFWILPGMVTSPTMLLMELLNQRVPAVGRKITKHSVQAYCNTAYYAI